MKEYEREKREAEEAAEDERIARERAMLAERFAREKREEEAQAAEKMLGKHGKRETGGGAGAALAEKPESLVDKVKRKQAAAVEAAANSATPQASVVATVADDALLSAGHEWNQSPPQQQQHPQLSIHDSPNVHQPQQDSDMQQYNHGHYYSPPPPPPPRPDSAMQRALAAHETELAMLKSSLIAMQMQASDGNFLKVSCRAPSYQPVH